MLFDTPEIFQVCHSEGGQRLTEESLLSAKDSLTESLERQLLCHSKTPIRGEELLFRLLVNAGLIVILSLRIKRRISVGD
ncbi:hypothetical protein [Helicobacter marmotae]|uniref:hypothetical protein n=1 Tax=Helicobacter marmotae TaxID=152490 RepID=UPI00131553FD|nr:hypothetical protein [Helicobacter marmotae]